MTDYLKAVHTGTQAVYEAKADAFAKHRLPLGAEKPWLDALMARVPRGRELLDLGCGTGDPVSAYLLDQRYRVTGVDYAAPMIRIARRRYPHATWLHADMRDLQLKTTYDAVLSWDGFFHLSQDEQRQALPMISRLVKPAGVLLLTIGHQEGELTGTVFGAAVYHASLNPEEYQETLEAQGFEVELSLSAHEENRRSILMGYKQA